MIAALGAAFRAAANGVQAASERRRLRQSFGSYVSPGVLDAILSGELLASGQGERRTLCVLFSDIRNFTSRSETQPPEAIVSLLNRYFAEMTQCVHAHGGTVDKFIGDGLMAFFGAPASSANCARDAFDAAVEMLERLDRLNAELAAEGLETVAIGVGLHLGEVVVGHIGSHDRHEYTVIGDTVNTASRLEALTKSLGHPVLCSGTVADALGPEAGLVPLGEQAVKGRASVPVHGWSPREEDGPA